MANKDFGEYVRKLRTERTYSLKQLADEIEITPYYLSYIESGKKTNPNQKIIARMFVVLRMSKSEIEHFLDLHAKANGIVSYDIAEYIMQMMIFVRKFVQQEINKELLRIGMTS